MFHCAHYIYTWYNAQAAMAENLADPRTNAPNEQHVKLYASWGETKAGLLVTGNVMVDPRYLEAPGNVAVDDDCCLSVLQRWADASQANGSATIVQLSHPGTSFCFCHWQRCAALYSLLYCFV